MTKRRYATLITDYTKQAVVNVNILFGVRVENGRDGVQVMNSVWEVNTARRALLQLDSSSENKNIVMW